MKDKGPEYLFRILSLLQTPPKHPYLVIAMFFFHSWNTYSPNYQMD